MGSWFVRPTESPVATARLFCIPYAGVGPSAYRGWGPALAPDVEAIYVQLPGREARLREAALTSVATIAETLVDEMTPWLDRPFALFGHSLGGVVAFETARTLARRGLHPVRLFVSATRAPHLPYPYPSLRGFEGVELLRLVNERYNGSVPPQILSTPELFELVVPPLRADLTALETYNHHPVAPLECPISAFAGREDPTVAIDDVRAWSRHSKCGASVRVVEAGHLFLQSAMATLVDAIRADLRVCRATREGVA